MNVSSVDIKIDNTDLAKDELHKAMAVALEAVGLQAEEYAKGLCPVDTGLLRNSITHAVSDDSGGQAAYIGTNVEYAAYVEMGTSRSKAQPYLKPAAENHKEEYKQIIKEQLENAQV